MPLIQFDNTETALVPTDPALLAEYMRGLASGEPDIAGEQALAGLDPRQMVPTLRMNKPSSGSDEGTFELTLAGKSLWPAPRRKIHLIVLATYGQRANFAPGTMEERQAAGQMRPVCGCSLTEHNDLMNTTTHGQWFDETFPAPSVGVQDASGRIHVPCSRCPWAAFGSLADWYRKGGKVLGRESKAPACNRSRVLMLQFAREKVKLPVQGEDEYSLFDYDPEFQEAFAMTALSFATNNNPYKDLVAAWAAKASSGGSGKVRLRLPQTVFEATVGRTTDAYRNPVLRTRVAGMVLPPFWKVIDGQILPAVYKFVADARARGGEFVSEAEYEPLPEPHRDDAGRRAPDIDVPWVPGGEEGEIPA